MAVEKTEIQEENEQAEKQKEKKKLPIKLMIIALVALLLVSGLAAGYFLFLGPKMKSSGKAATAEKEPKQAHAAEQETTKEEGSIKQLDAFIVNLSDESGDRYLKVVMQLEMNKTELEAEIVNKMPQIRDEILMLLSNKSFDDVGTMAGKRMLKREIINGVNKYLTTGQVVQVYFSEFVVQ
jgi:flagellar protein FliL